MTITDLQKIGIEARLDGDRLVLKGQINDDMIQMIRHHRETLITELRSRTCSRCFSWWRVDAFAGDCLLLGIKTNATEDCGGWKPWAGHGVRSDHTKSDDYWSRDTHADRALTDRGVE